MQQTLESSASPRTPTHWRDLRVRPTPFGVWFAVFGTLMLIGCINYQLSLGYFFTFWLLSLWPLCALSALRGLLGLSFSARADSQSVYAGGRAHVVLTCDNPTKGVRPALSLKVGALEIPLETRPNSSTQTDLHLPAPTRGWLKLPPLRLESSDALGLFRARLERTFPLQVLVYPALELDPPGWPDLSPRVDHNASASAGKSVLHPSGEGEDFAGLRPYQPGDPLRRIAWRQSAKGDTLLTKQFETPTSSALWLSWNALPIQLTLEPRLSRLTAWALSAERGSAPYALELPGQTLEPGQGEAHLRRVLTALALYQTPDSSREGRP